MINKHTPTEDIIDYTKIGNKSKNLLKLKEIENKDIFIVPDFKCIGEEYSTKEILEIKKYFKQKKVAVRSSSNLEDSDNNSFAGAFETYLNIDVDDIEYYIQKIYNHSLKKFGIKIPIVIQEMVENIKHSGVVFNYDIDENKPYYIINHHDGIGEELVSGEKTGKISKIIHSIDIKKIDNIFIKRLIESIKYIEKELKEFDIDVEFAYDGKQINLLQVRPITTIKKEKNNINEVAARYGKYLANIINKNNIVLGDMIDINPEELVGKKNLLTKTFFEYIFPKNSLKKSREDLGYSYVDNFSNFVLNKMYIDLEKNLLSFLPASLNEEEKRIFIYYYKTKLNQNPGIQNSLDSREYPINTDVVKNILNSLDINENIKISIINKFNIFFNSLENKLNVFYNNYENLETNIINDLGVNNLLDLSKVNLQKKSIDYILDKILYVTYQFSIHARGAFYYDNKQKSSGKYYKKNIYMNKLLLELKKRGSSLIDFTIPDGFDFFSEISNSFSINNNEIFGFSGHIEKNELDVFLVARDNLKFVFMVLIRELGEKIKSIILEDGINPKDIDNLDFGSLLDYIKGNINKDNLYFNQKKGNNKANIMKVLNLSPVINKKNNIEQLYDKFSNGYFIGQKKLIGDAVYVNDVKDIKEIAIKDKILIIENATPEIDIHLKNISGIITKNGGPLAHIAIRARELGIPAVVGIGDEFNIIKEYNKINVDFQNKTLNP